MHIKPVVIFFAVISIWSCSGKSNESPVAEVRDKRLYLSQISEIFTGLSPEDSLNVLRDYVGRWVKNQLVLRQAELNLSKAQKDVSYQLDSYRASLLIFKYEQAYVEQRSDTIVSMSEIEKFYTDNPDNFRLLGLLVKGTYIKVRSKSRNIDKIRLLYRSNRDKDFDELEKLCITGVEKFDLFKGDWIDFSTLSKEFPPNVDGYENKIYRQRYLDESDGEYTYLLSVKEIASKGAAAPLEHVRDEIKTIILNRRKINLIKKLENNIYNEALRKNEVKIYIDDYE